MPVGKPFNLHLYLYLAFIKNIVQLTLACCTGNQYFTIIESSTWLPECQPNWKFYMISKVTKEALYYLFYINSGSKCTSVICGPIMH